MVASLAGTWRLVGGRSVFVARGSLDAPLDAQAWKQHVIMSMRLANALGVPTSNGIVPATGMRDILQYPSGKLLLPARVSTCQYPLAGAGR